MKSLIVKNNCPTCGAVAVEISRLDLGSSKFISLKCGHVITEEVIPESDYSSIKSSDGRSLMPFQIEGIKFCEAANARALIADEQGLGKAQSIDSKLLTPTGWVRMGNIRIGDMVFAEDGQPYPVSAIFPQGLIDTYKITFSDGSSTTCCDSHLWNVKCPNDVNRGKSWRTKSTFALRHDLKTGQGYPKWMIPITKPVDFQNNERKEISPYLLGCLLGDGCFRQHQISICSADDEIIEAFQHIRQDKNSYFLDASWKRKIRNLALDGCDSESKFIPRPYKLGTIQERLDLLRGLMDTDGSIWNNGVVEYTTVSTHLAQDVVFLVESLGGTTKLSFKIGKYEYKGEKLTGKIAYRVVINLPVNPFRLNRKANLWQEREKYKPNRYIKSIEYIGLVECQCITVDSPNHLYLTDNCIVTHNTVQACGLLSLHPELLPAIIVTKTTIKKQWMWELFRWTNTKRVQVINSSKEVAVDGFDYYVTTYDMIKNESMFSHITPQTLILDECQAIKNHLSGRAKAIQKIGKDIPHIIGMSGTPIKNNAGEYFTILNLLQPSRFVEYSRFLRTYCDSYESLYGYKVGGLSSLDKFQEATNDFIIRRTQKDVLPDLFALKQPRKFHHVELDKKFNKAYAEGLEALDDLFYRDEDENTTSATIAIMNRLRQITGLSKTIEAVDYVTEHLLSTGRKIIIFAHHHAVVDLLENNLNSWLSDGGYGKCVVLRAGDNGSDKIATFSSADKPVLIASTLASGEGLDGLQKICSDMIILERQWNPANEEQVEGRLARIGQTLPVNFIYMIASGTIDEMFTELVEKKRSYVSQALDGQVINWEENSLIKELASLLVMSNRKKWTL